MSFSLKLPCNRFIFCHRFDVSLLLAWWVLFMCTCWSIFKFGLFSPFSIVNIPFFHSKHAFDQTRFRLEGLALRRTVQYRLTWAFLIIKYYWWLWKKDYIVWMEKNISRFRQATSKLEEDEAEVEGDVYNGKRDIIWKKFALRYKLADKFLRKTQNEEAAYTLQKSPWALSCPAIIFLWFQQINHFI